MSIETVYTHATWRVKSGREDEFVAAWEALSAVFAALPAPPGRGTLLRSTVDPAVFHSFGPWQRREHVAEMRADPAAQRALQHITGLCDEATPELCEFVRAADPIETGGHP